MINSLHYTIKNLTSIAHVVCLELVFVTFLILSSFDLNNKELDACIKQRFSLQLLTQISMKPHFNCTVSEICRYIIANHGNSLRCVFQTPDMAVIFRKIAFAIFTRLNSGTHKSATASSKNLFVGFPTTVAVTPVAYSRALIKQLSVSCEVSDQHSKM